MNNSVITLVLDARMNSVHFPGIGRYVTNLARALSTTLPDQMAMIILSTSHPSHY